MRMNAKLLRYGVLAAIAGAALLVLARPPEQGAPPAPADPNYFAFVRSMEGTRPDGDIRQNASDQLVVNAELAHLFDYYLSAQGEKPLDAIRFEIARELDKRLRPNAAAQARQLLEKYLQYKRALVDVERALPVPKTPLEGAQTRLRTMQRVRHDYFSDEEIAGLFGASDAYDQDALARLEIASDTSLTPQQRAQKLAAFEARQPAAVREEREAPLRVLHLEEAVQQARAKGADDNEIYRMRAAAFSPEAAARLAGWVDRIRPDRQVFYGEPELGTFPW